MAWLQKLISTAICLVAILPGSASVKPHIEVEYDTVGEESIPPCDSKIYCDGPILQAVQTSRLFNDTKTFVDMPMKLDPDEVMKAFAEIKTGDKQELQTFVDNYFEEAGSDTEFVIPEDWVERPTFVEKIRDQKLQEWALELNKIWNILFKKTKADVVNNPQRYSLIPLPHPFVVPGGRFREIYYWDTFWVNKGLLLCNMSQSVRGILLNYVSFIDRYGLIPNGARNYFTRRSQPPMFAAMVHDYVRHTGDEDFLREVLPALEKEYDFWMKFRNVTVWKDGQSYTLQRYLSTVTKPRPEGYKEDTETASRASGDSGELYGELHAGAESGWDYSGRWFNRDGPNNMTIRSIRTSKIVPVDLNSIMFSIETTLEEFNRALGNKERENFFAQQKTARVEAIERILWDESSGSWFDFDLEKNKSSPHFYSSAGFPIFTDCHGSSRTTKHKREEAFLAYLRSSGALDYPGGIPTSLYATGEQWDFPNAWPPLVHVIIMGLAKSEVNSVQEAARNLAQQWIKTNYNAWKKSGHMFEKYDVVTGSGPGGGGEYDVQVGFGWTNGVILDLLYHFGEVLTSEDIPSAEDKEPPPNPSRDVGDDSLTKGKKTPADPSRDVGNDQLSKEEEAKEEDTPTERKKRRANSPDGNASNSQHYWDYPMVLTFVVIIASCAFVFVSFAL